MKGRKEEQESFLNETNAHRKFGQACDCESVLIEAAPEAVQCEGLDIYIYL